MSMNLNMNKTVCSAMMFAMLCTGALTPGHFNQAGHLVNPGVEAVAQYQMMSQNVSFDLDDTSDDEEIPGEDALK